MSVLALRLPRRYGVPVAANSATGRRNPNNERRTSAKANMGAFLLPVFYGGCARARFGVAGALSCRFPTPRTAATPARRKAGGSSPTKGAATMQTTRNPSPHAAAWKARALAALRADCSLSVRLARYNEAMAKARALETVGGVQ